MPLTYFEKISRSKNPSFRQRWFKRTVQFSRGRRVCFQNSSAISNWAFSNKAGPTCVRCSVCLYCLSKLVFVWKKYRLNYCGWWSCICSCLRFFCPLMRVLVCVMSHIFWSVNLVHKASGLQHQNTWNKDGRKFQLLHVLCPHTQKKNLHNSKLLIGKEQPAQFKNFAGRKEPKEKKV